MKKRYRKGREYTESELRALPLGTVVWIYWAKDDNREYVRFNGAFKIVEFDLEEFSVGEHTEEWPYDGDTSRGCAHYYEALLG